MGHENDKPGQSNGAEYARVGIAPSLALGLGSANRATLSYYFLKVMMNLIQVFHSITQTLLIMMVHRNQMFLLVQKKEMVSLSLLSKEHIMVGKRVISTNAKTILAH